MATWREHLIGAMFDVADPGPVVAYAPDETQFDVQFHDGPGRANGPPVLAWTETHVYFPVTYEGEECLESAPRHPRDAGQDHIGGE